MHCEIMSLGRRWDNIKGYHEPALTSQPELGRQTPKQAAGNAALGSPGPIPAELLTLAKAASAAAAALDPALLAQAGPGTDYAPDLLLCNYYDEQVCV